MIKNPTITGTAAYFATINKKKLLVLYKKSVLAVMDIYHIA